MGLALSLLANNPEVECWTFQEHALRSHCGRRSFMIAEVIRGIDHTATIQELRRLFAAYGLPEQLVSDNGPQFISEEFFHCF